MPIVPVCKDCFRSFFFLHSLRVTASGNVVACLDVVPLSSWNCPGTFARFSGNVAHVALEKNTRVCCLPGSVVSVASVSVLRSRRLVWNFHRHSNRNHSLIHQPSPIVSGSGAELVRDGTGRDHTNSRVSVAVGRFSQSNTDHQGQFGTKT